MRHLTDVMAFPCKARGRPPYVILPHPSLSLPIPLLHRKPSLVLLPSAPIHTHPAHLERHPLPSPHPVFSPHPAPSSPTPSRSPSVSSPLSPNPPLIFPTPFRPPPRTPTLLCLFNSRPPHSPPPPPVTLAWRSLAYHRGI